MDIKYCGITRNVIPVLKDRTLRDCAQGFWRMRGIGAGEGAQHLVSDLRVESSRERE
jgi:hypothetical protein